MKKISIFIVLMMAVFTANAGENYLKVTPNMSPEKAKYAIENSCYTKITALETTAKGRIWASVLCGGDGADGYTSLVYSDSNGESWAEPIVTLDARDEKLAVRNGVLWRSPKGEMWFFYEVFDGYYDGRGSMWAMVPLR